MSDTLLSYAFLSTPSPLQAGTGATLTLVVSNPSGRLVQADAIVVTLPVGTTAKALVADAAGIGSAVPADWSSARSGGEFRLTPLTDEAKRVGAAGLAFVFANVQVNDEPGTTLVAVDETAAYVGGTPAERSTGLPLSKFPRQFQLSELRAEPLGVDAGGTATLQWTGTPATYRMLYSPGSGAPLDVPVGSTGPYVSQPLHRPPYVVFTLVVSVAVPGEDQPLVLQRQRTVEVRALSIDRFTALPPIVPVNGVAKLSWVTSNAVSVTIQPGNHSVEPSGSLYVAMPEKDTFTLIAVDAAGNTATEERTVRTDPSLQVNAERFDYDGCPGAQSSPGAPGGFGHPPGPGSAGGNGTSGGIATVRVGPLDVTGTSGRVRGVFARGGAGMPGGTGGNAVGSWAGGRGGPGGCGGGGGRLTVQIESSGTPAQLVVDASGGTAGAGGPGGSGSPPGLPGQPGQPGPPDEVILEGLGASSRASARRLAPTRSDTLLGYGLLEETDDGMLMLSLSVSGTAPDLASISIPLPLLSRPDGWTAAYDGGVTTLAPPAAVPAGGATFTFLPSGGPPPSLEVRETAGGQTRTALFTLDPPGSTP